MNCPKCGAKVAADRPCITIFQCGSECDKDPSAFYETPQCLRNQLAAMTAEYEAGQERIVELIRAVALRDHSLNKVRGESEERRKLALAFEAKYDDLKQSHDRLMAAVPRQLVIGMRDYARDCGRKIFLNGNDGDIYREGLCDEYDLFLRLAAACGLDVPEIEGPAAAKENKK